MPGKLILVRHGQSVWNLENLFTGWHDVDLTDQGRIEEDAPLNFSPLPPADALPTLW